MPCCVEVGCSNRTETGFSLLRFPRDLHRRTVWAAKVNRDKWIPSDASFLCEVHTKSAAT